MTTVDEPAPEQPFVLRRRSPEDIAGIAERERADARLVKTIGRILLDAESLEDAGAQLLSVGDAKDIGADLLDEMAKERQETTP